MKKTSIKITESKLNKIISESVRKALLEWDRDDPDEGPEDFDDSRHWGETSVDIYNAYPEAYKKIFGKDVPEDFEEMIEDLPFEINISYDYTIATYSGDYYTPGGSEVENFDWEITDDLSNYLPYVQELIKKATTITVDKMDCTEFD